MCLICPHMLGVAPSALRFYQQQFIHPWMTVSAPSMHGPICMVGATWILVEPKVGGRYLAWWVLVLLGNGTHASCMSRPALPCMSCPLYGSCTVGLCSCCSYACAIIWRIMRGHGCQRTGGGATCPHDGCRHMWSGSFGLAVLQSFLGGKLKYNKCPQAMWGFVSVLCGLALCSLHLLADFHEWVPPTSMFAIWPLSFIPVDCGLAVVKRCHLWLSSECCRLVPSITGAHDL